MICIKRDVTDPAAAPLLMAKGFQSNPDGSTSILMPDGTYASQEPMQYGVFSFQTHIGPYERCVLNGQLVSFWTRPQDPPYAYSWVDLP